MYACMHTCMYAWMNGWMDKWIDGWMDVFECVNVCAHMRDLLVRKWMLHLLPISLFVALSHSIRIIYSCVD